MAGITGGNIIFFVTGIIILMIVAALIVFVYSFTFNDILSLSFNNLVSREQLGDTPETVPNTADIVAKTRDPEDTRQALGFINYPVVEIQTSQLSIFSPDFKKATSELTYG